MDTYNKDLVAIVNPEFENLAAAKTAVQQDVYPASSNHRIQTYVRAARL